MDDAGDTDTALPLDLLLGALAVVNTVGPALSWSFADAPVAGLPAATATTLGLAGAILIAVAILVRVLPRPPRALLLLAGAVLVPVVVFQVRAVSSGGADPMLIGAVLFTTAFAYRTMATGWTRSSRRERARSATS